MRKFFRYIKGFIVWFMVLFLLKWIIEFWLVMINFFSNCLSKFYIGIFNRFNVIGFFLKLYLILLNKLYSLNKFDIIWNFIC